MRRQRVLLTLAAIIIGVIVLQEPASADCEGPTLDYETGEFAPGETIEVTGQWFGNNCYDTGPPPDGEGFLGLPIEGIDIVVVQGTNEWTVATGDADADYAFAVRVMLPPDLGSGEATVTARYAADWGPWIATTEPLIITDDPPLVEELEVATFAPAVPATLPVPEPADDDTGRATWIALAMVVAAAAIGGLLVLSRR